MSRARTAVAPLRRFAGAFLGLSALSSVAVAGCNKTRPAAIVVTPDASVDAGDAGSAYTIQTLGCGSAGTQTSVAVAGSKIAFASLAKTTSTQMCTIMPMQMPTTSEVPLWNVCYAESNPDGTFSSQVVTQQPYIVNSGVGLALDTSGNPTIAYTGVGSTPSAERCGANDVFVTTEAGGTFGMPFQVSNGSQSNGLVEGMAGNCAQNVCNEGDTTGWWAALGFDPTGNTFLAYRDVHFGFAMDDYAKSDVELAEGTGTSYQVLTVDVSRGAGIYNRMAFTPSGLPAILSFDQFGTNPGVYIDLQLIAGGFSTQEGAGGWGAAQVSDGPVGEQLGFGINSMGLFAAAYYDMGTSRLLYVESMDGMTWSSPSSVDLDGTTGFYPSLAFDSSGEPAIAYYRCSSSEGVGMNCDAATDGLMLARRNGTVWTVEEVRSDPTVNDGLYPALAFVDGKVVIAYQITSYDAVSMTSSATWWVAEGQ